MNDDWTNEWPTAPGWYWVWWPSRQPGKTNPPTVGRALAVGPLDRLSVIFTVCGSPVSKHTDSDLRWGPRIDVPDAPDGTPGTRFAVAVLVDQAHLYLTDCGQLTTRHANAEVFTDRRSAEDALDSHFNGDGGAAGWVEAIDDLDEFRSREDAL